MKEVFRSLFFLVGLSCFISLANSNAQNKPPEWISTPTFKKGKDVYFVGMGINKDMVKAREEAMDDVKTKIVEMIFAEVAVEARKEFLYVSGDKSSEVVERVEEDMVVKSKARIYVPVPEDQFSYQDKNGNYVVYVLVRFPEPKILEERQRIEQMYRDMLRSVDKFIEEGDAFVREGKLINAIASYVLAAKNSLEVEEKKMLYPEIVKKIDDILSRITIEVVDGDNRKVGVGEGGEIKFGVYYNIEGVKVPVRDVNLMFRVSSGGAEINSSATSDSNGIAVCLVSRVVRFDNRRMSVRAFLNLDFSPLSAISQEAKRDASRLVTKSRLIRGEASWFMSTSKAKNATIVVLSSKQGGGYTYNAKMSSSLASYVMKKGYRVSKPRSTSILSDEFEKIKRHIPDDSVLILVKVSEPQERTIDFGSEKVNRVETEVSIEVYDQGGNIINSDSKRLISSSVTSMEANLLKNIGERLEEMEF